MARNSVDRRFKQALAEARSNMPHLDAELLERAWRQAAAWAGRKGEDYAQTILTHGIDVARRVATLRRGTNSVVVALIHPLLEDNVITRKELADQFGDDVAQLAQDVATLSKLNFHSKKAEQIKSFRKMFLGMANDIRAILIKMVDREQLLDSMDDFDADRQRLIGEETLNVYAPIAGRLGIQRLKIGLEDRAFAMVDPAAHMRISGFVDRFRSERQTYIDRAVAEIQSVLTPGGVTAKVYGRIKHAYSIHRKMRNKQLDLSEVYDVVAFRVIVDNVEQCYQTLGLIHSRWHPIQHKFKDYIATPKPNGYRSLHTNVIGPLGDRMEVQIRTKEMHEIAENGVAAHWKYKESNKSKADRAADKEKLEVQWLRTLMSMPEDLSESEGFLDNLKLDMFSDYVFAFTPNNDVVELPAGSTAVDFAFAVHTQVGMHITGAKVNGRLVPIRHQLQNGDVVEITTQSSQKPRREWLDFVRTGRARSKIRHAISEEEREASRKLGRELCEREFKKFGINLNRLEKSGDLDKAAQKLKLRDFQELQVSLGRGKTRCRDFLKAVDPDKAAELEAAEAAAAAAAAEVQEAEKKPKRHRRSRGGIRISDIDDIMVRYGKCCNPIPGDRIIGFVTRGRGVTIHRAGCSKIPKGEDERIIDAFWDAKDEFELPVALKVISRDRSGILKDLSGVFAANNVNIDSVHAESEDGIGSSIFRMRVPDLDMLDKLKRDLVRVKGVVRVDRVIDHHGD